MKPNFYRTERAARVFIQLGHPQRPVGEHPGSPRTPAERARLKSCKDDTTIARGKRGTSAALGRRYKMILSPFSNRVWRAGARQTRLEKGEVGLGWRFTRGGGLGGLAPGYYQAAPPGLRRGMNDERLKGFGRLWANHRLQPRPGSAWLIVLRPRPGRPGPDRSPQSHAIDISPHPG